MATSFLAFSGDLVSFPFLVALSLFREGEPLSLSARE